MFRLSWRINESSLFKFNLELETDAQLESRFDKWLYIFRHLADLQNRPSALQERIFQKLFEAAEIAKFSPKEREKYEESLKYYRDLKNVVDTSKEEGREEGLEEGKEQGREERSIEIAKNLKKQGVGIHIIVQATGLSVDEINRL